MPPPATYYGLILAGGRGTRFWPRSRRARAKQVLRFLGDRSLIQQTFDRLSALIPPERLWVLTNDHLRAEIVRQLPEVPKNQILAEPTQRNTAPAIGLAAHILQSIDTQAVMGVFPSDHMISKPHATCVSCEALSKPQPRVKIVGTRNSAALARNGLRLRRVSQGRSRWIAGTASGSQVSRRSPIWPALSAT